MSDFSENTDWPDSLGWKLFSSISTRSIIWQRTKHSFSLADLSLYYVYHCSVSCSKWQRFISQRHVWDIVRVGWAHTNFEGFIQGQTYEGFYLFTYNSVCKIIWSFRQVMIKIMSLRYYITLWVWYELKWLHALANKQKYIKSHL